MIFFADLYSLKHFINRDSPQIASPGIESSLKFIPYPISKCLTPAL